MAKRGSQKGDQRLDQEAAKDAREIDAGRPSEGEETEAGLPLDTLLQAGGETEPSSGKDGEDLASLLASFQDQGDKEGENGAETDEDRELSQMISLMASRDPGQAYPAKEKTQETPDTLPEGSEVILDPLSETQDGEETTLAEAFSDASDSDGPDSSGEEGGDLSEETALASLAGDEEVEQEAVPEAEAPAPGTKTPSVTGEEDVEAEALEGYEVADNVDVLLSTIGLDDEHEGRSFAPPIPEGGIQDDGTPPEDLVDERILDDLRELHENLNSSPPPAIAGLSALAGLSGGLTEGPARILSIDDDPDNRSLFRGILDGKDYAFSDVESGEEALEALRDGEVDLVLLNLDVASQDGFELIEEAASDVTLSQVPILVNSASTDHIEKALRLGASDYFVRPMNVIDVKFQIPIKVRNLLKLRRAERMLALAGDHPSDALPAPPQEEEELGTQTPKAAVPGDDDLAALLNAPEDKPLTGTETALEASSLEALFDEDDEDTEETGSAEEDLTAALAENEEALFGEDLRDTDDADEDLTAALAEDEEDLFKEGPEDGEEEPSTGSGAQEDLTAALTSEERTLDRSLEDEDTSDRPEETGQPPGRAGETVGLSLAGVAAASVGARALRSNARADEGIMSAADILAQPARKGSSPLWRSPDLARGERERRLQGRRGGIRPGSRRLLYATLALLLVGVGVWALWAKQRLRETGQVTSVFPTPPKFQAPEAISEEKPAESSPAPPEKSEGASPLSSPGRESGDYERARERASLPSREAKQLASEKAHLRATVDQIAAQGGQWWAPWQVIRASGESIRGLVNERSKEDILEVFSADEQKVERGLRRKAIVDFLSKRGFKVRGKQASELSAREMFEVLSMREIKTKDRIVAILSALKDKAEAARAGRAARLKEVRPSRLALRPQPLEVHPPVRSAVVWEQPDQRSATPNLPVFTDS